MTYCMRLHTHHEECHGITAQPMHVEDLHSGLPGILYAPAGRMAHTEYAANTGTESADMALFPDRLVLLAALSQSLGSTEDTSIQIRNP